MDDKARFFNIRDQSTVIQLIVFIATVIIGGTLLFYLFLFAGTLIFGTGISELLSLPAANAGLTEVSILKYLQVSQHISLFIIPAIVVAILIKKGNESFLRVNRVPESIQIFMVAMLALFIFPVTSYTGILNSKMVLPDWLSGVEEWIRAKENIASDLTGLLIKSAGIRELVINIIILAVIPSIAEEMIFRGILQQLLCKIFRSGHLGIWITAILFSAIHLQFFGFLPRLILGLSFGYLFFWSRNLWLPVIAHFINNCVPVVISYFVGWEKLTGKASGLAEKQILPQVFAAFFCILIFYYFWSEHRKNIGES
jgi:membrane protease YdiL (CAAX protease family)